MDDQNNFPSDSDTGMGWGKIAAIAVAGIAGAGALTYATYKAVTNSSRLDDAELSLKLLSNKLNKCQDAIDKINDTNNGRSNLGGSQDDQNS